MAESKPIQHDEIIQPDVFKNTSDSADVLIGKLQLLLGGFKQLFNITGEKIRTIDPKTISDADKLAKAYVDTGIAMKGYNEVQKETIYLTEKKKLLVKQANDAIKDEVKVQAAAKGSVAELRAELSKLEREYVNMAGATKEDIKLRTEQGKKVLEVREKLKDLEGATGDHRREVGNYAVAAKGLSGILLGLGGALGYNTEQLEKLNESHKVLRETLHGTHELLHNIGISHHEVGEAAKSEAEAEGEANEIRMASLPTIALVATAVVALGAAIYDLVKPTETSSEAVARLKKELEEQAENGQINNETLKEYKEASERAQNAQELLETSIGDANEELKKQKELLEEIDEYGRRKLSTDDVKTRILTGIDKSKITVKELTSALSDLKEEQSKFTLDKAKKQFEDLQNTGSHLSIAGLSKEQIKEMEKDSYSLDTSLEAVTDRYKEEAKEIEKTIVLIEKEIKAREIKKVKEKEFKIKKIRPEQDFNVPLFDDGELEEIEERQQIKQDKQKAYDEWWDNYTNELYKKAEQRRQERIDRVIEEQRMITDATAKAFEERINLEKKYNENQNQLATEQIQTQTALAAAGKRNTLDFEYREKAKAIEEQKKLDEKAHKEQEALQLANIFLEYEKIYAKEGPGAAGKALTQTLLAKATATAISAAFAEEGGIVGEIKEAPLFARRHKSGNDVLVQAEKGEGIIPVWKMNQLGLNNKGAFNEWLSKGNLFAPNFNDNSELVSEIKGLRQDIKNKKETWVDRDTMTGLIRLVEKENGVQRNYIQKNYDIIPRETYRA